MIVGLDRIRDDVTGNEIKTFGVSGTQDELKRFYNKEPEEEHENEIEEKENDIDKLISQYLKEIDNMNINYDEI